MADIRLGTSLSRCLCSACDRVFSGPSTFDTHWQGAGEDRHCVDPASVLDNKDQPRLRLEDGIWRNAQVQVDVPWKKEPIVFVGEDGPE